MTEECVHEMALESCGLCRPRPGAVDLHGNRVSHGGDSRYADEVAAIVTIAGDSFGLVPSDGQAYVFGTGSALHHDRECIEGSDTPPDRVRKYADPDGELWSAVLSPGADNVVNVSGRPVTRVCQLCALRPITS